MDRDRMHRLLTARFLFRSFVAVLAGILVVLIAGMILPRFFIETGVESFEGKERKTAQGALDSARSDYSEFPGPGVWTTAYQVVGLEECPNATADPPEGETVAQSRDITIGEGEGDDVESPRMEAISRPAFSAEVQTYTIFGISSGKWSLDCEGTYDLNDSSRRWPNFS